MSTSNRILSDMIDIIRIRILNMKKYDIGDIRLYTIRFIPM